METAHSKSMQPKLTMSSLLKEHMKNNPKETHLSKSIIKKAFFRAKRGPQAEAIKRLKKLKHSKAYKFNKSFSNESQRKNWKSSSAPFASRFS